MCINYYDIIKVFFIMDLEFSKPSLIEPGARYFLNETLSRCSKFKEQYYNNIVNISIAAFIILIVAIYLYYKYKGKPSPSEKMLKDRERKHYILSRIKNYQDAKRMESQTLITGMPTWENEYDTM